MDIIEKVKNRLKKESNEKYRNFSSSLIPDTDNILGVRVPILRQIAKEIVKDDWQKFLNFETEYFEETMLQGIVIGLLKLDCDSTLKLIKNFIPKINNWAVCDIFCNSLKFTQKNKKKVWEFLQQYKNSQKEYEIRFVFVMFLSHFIQKEYLEKIFEIVNNFKNEKYYAKMAAAWLVSICYIKYPEQTEAFLKNTQLDDETYNKSIQKIIESGRIAPDIKEKLKKLKRKK